MVGQPVKERAGQEEKKDSKRKRECNCVNPRAHMS